jgi:hypothetical protein
MTDLERTPRRWSSWVEEACAAVGVDPGEVDIVEIHRLSREVAHRLERPLAPVSTFVLGMALASHSGHDRAAIVERILDTLPAESTDTDVSAERRP